MPASDHQHLPMWRRHLAIASMASIVIALVGVIAVVGWQRFRPALKVTVVSAATITSSLVGDSARAGESAVVAQAAGWIEPDPRPVDVASVIDGVVNEILVREGDVVEAGAVILRLDPRDAELDARVAESALVEAGARRRQAEATLAAHQARVEVERARLAELEEAARRLADAGPAIASGDVRQAGLRVVTQRATIAAQVADREVLAAVLTVAEADLAAARIAVERVGLILERTIVRAPVAGIVMRMLVQRGSRVLAGDGDRALLAELFEPERLQVRVDVPLADAAKLVVGQRVQVVVEPWPDRLFEGVVSRLAGTADVSRNTLQAKVRLLQPIPAMRPEMLARARFLVVESGLGGKEASSGGVAVYAPEKTLRSVSGDRAVAWIVDLDERLRRRDVRLGAGRRDGWVEVRDGLFPGDLIAIGDDTGWRDGRRVEPQRREEP